MTANTNSTRSVRLVVAVCDDTCTELALAVETATRPVAILYVVT